MNISEDTLLTVKSNIYKLESDGQPRYAKKNDDYYFLGIIREAAALRKLKIIAPWYNYSAIQNEIILKTAPCAYRLPDDHPWGSMYDSNNIEKIICKCINTNCELFNDCRPDFNTEELIVLDDNRNKSVYDTSVILSEIVEENKKNDIEDHIKIEETVITEDQILPEINLPPLISTPIVKESEKSVFDTFKSVEQDYLINMDITKRTIVNAGPGTGKTYTLIEKLMYMLGRQNSDPKTIAVLCYSRAAVDVIQTRLKRAYEDGQIGDSWHQIEVRTFDSFCASMIDYTLRNHPDLLPQGYDFELNDYDSGIVKAENILREQEDILSRYKHIIIDEVQDLVDCRASLVLQLLDILDDNCGFTLLGDSCQALYDYLANNDENIITSNKFYRSLFENFPDAERLSFEKNHRQCDNHELGLLTVPYRKAILRKEFFHNSGFDEINDIHTRIIERIPVTRTTQKGSREILATINGIREEGETLGILTRTNGLALMISTWLHNDRIMHTLLKSADSLFFNRWIADILTNYDNNEINAELFSEKYMQIHPDADIDMVRVCWNVLTERAHGNGRWYTVSDILESLLALPKNNLLYSGRNNSVGITVSTIHRAKGREFDRVLLIEEDDNNFDNHENNELSEHKVRYVALTRPRKDIMRHIMDCQYVYIDKEKNRRCSKANPPAWGKKWRGLSHIEIGCNGDIDPNSFARNELTQAYISKEIKSMDRLILKIIDGTLSDYSILPEDITKEYGYLHIGKTDYAFSTGITRAQRRIWSKNWYSNNIDEKLDYYPSKFSEIYVEDIITCISKRNNNDRPHIRSFGDFSIWWGFTVRGFAQKENDRF